MSSALLGGLLSSCIPTSRQKTPAQCHFDYDFAAWLFHCCVYGGGPEQQAIETNLTKASPVNDLSKLLRAIKATHGM